MVGKCQDIYLVWLGNVEVYIWYGWECRGIYVLFKVWNWNDLLQTREIQPCWTTLPTSYKDKS